MTNGAERASWGDQGTPETTNATLTSPVGPDGIAPLGVPVEIPARQGRAFALRASQRLRLVNTHGSQVADFWAFAADDPREYLSMEHVRTALRRLTPWPGDVLVSNRCEALLTLLADSSPGVHDTLIASATSTATASSAMTACTTTAPTICAWRCSRSGGGRSRSPARSTSG
jgi:hypothetical protein